MYSNEINRVRDRKHIMRTLWTECERRENGEKMGRITQVYAL